MMSMGEGSSRSIAEDINTGGGEEERKRYIENLKKKGVQEFNIGGRIILARSFENALKKAKKLKT